MKRTIYESINRLRGEKRCLYLALACEILHTLHYCARNADGDQFAHQVQNFCACSVLYSCYEPKGPFFSSSLSQLIGSFLSSTSCVDPEAAAAAVSDLLRHCSLAGYLHVGDQGCQDLRPQQRLLFAQVRRHHEDVPLVQPAAGPEEPQTDARHERQERKYSAHAKMRPQKITTGALV